LVVKKERSNTTIESGALKKALRLFSRFLNSFRQVRNVQVLSLFSQARKTVRGAVGTVSYPSAKASGLPASPPHLASSLTLGREEEVLGEAPQAQRVAPTLLFLREQGKR